MPVPAYLQDIACDVSTKDDLTSFRLRCSCGCEGLHIYVSCPDKEEKEMCRPYYEALEHSVTGGCFSGCTRDENGTVHHWIYLTPDRNGPKEEVIIPPEPLCACIQVIKARCPECGNEYVIYDSRYHGYSGVFCSDAAKREYSPHFRLKKRRGGNTFRLLVSIEHSVSYEELNREIPCGYTQYSDAFTWIAVYSSDGDKKRKLFEYETD